MYKKYNGNDIVICKKILNNFQKIIKLKSDDTKLEELLKIKLNPDNIKSAIESFANSPESESFPYFDYKFAHIFVKSFLDLFDKIPNDGQYKVDPIIINRCIRKFDVATEPVKLESESILKIMEYTDCEKQIPSENKSANAIIDNFRLLAKKFEVPDLFIKFTFKFMDFEKLKQPQQESIDEKNARYDLIYDIIYTLVDRVCADTWFDAFKRLLQDDIYSEFVDALNDIEDIGDILSFETMDKFDLRSVEKLKRWLKNEHLKFVIENGKNGNKKINVVVEENYIDQKQKLELVDKIKIPNTIESRNDGNKVANKWVLKIFFIPNKNKNKRILFVLDIVLFFIILSVFIALYSIRH